MNNDPKMTKFQGNQQSEANAEKQKEMAEQQEMVKNSILKQILDQDAFSRLSNLAVVKPEKATTVENLIVRMARTGQLNGKLTDGGLKDLLDKISARQKTTTVKFDRRRAALDSDEDEY